MTSSRVKHGHSTTITSIPQSSQASATLDDFVSSTLHQAVATATSSSIDYKQHHQLLQNFTKPYLLAHRLSHPSRRYPDYLWFGIIGIFVIWSLEHILSRGGHSGAFGALQRKIGIRRFAIGPGARRKPKVVDAKPVIAPKKVVAGARRLWTTPTIAQMVSMLFMMGGIYAVCFWGDDYVNPKQCFWGGQGCNLISSNPQTISNYVMPHAHVADRPLHRPSLRSRHHSRIRASPKLAVNASFAYEADTDPLLVTADSAIHRTVWTSADRIGLIAFALTPLVVTLAMKMWPFAAFAVPFLMSYEFDKTVMYHRWIGIIIWLLSTAHTVLWVVQLVEDKDPLGKPVLYGMIYYWHFEAAIVAYVALTCMIICSLTSLRTRYYEFFYLSHMILGVLFLVGCILHFWRSAVYVFIACGIWAADRLARTVHWLWLNGFTKGLSFSEAQSPALSKIHNQATRRRQPSLLVEKQAYPAALNQSLAKRWSQAPLNLLRKSLDYPPLLNGSTFLSPAHASWRPTPPPGFALAQLLPGRNIRLTIRTPSIIHWRTGQYTLLTIPSVHPFQAHPFTIANADERQIRPVDYPVGSEIVLVVGARKGFTKKLWDHIVDKRKMFGPSATASSGGVLLRAQVSKPLGTAGRARLNDFDSVLIICGGTGASFGMAVMEHVCMSMAVRDGDPRAAANSTCKTKRVRFIWIVREFCTVFDI